MMKKSLILLLAVATTAVFLHADAVTLPKGKPFQAIQSSLDSLQSQVDALVGDNINSVEERLVALENAVVTLDANVADNLALINLMQAEIDSLAEALSLKQNIINGTCPNGQAIVSINSDGSISCATVGSSNDTIQRTTSYNVVEIFSFTHQTGVMCSSGYTLAGGGYKTVINSGITIHENRPATTNGWVMSVNLTNPTEGSELLTIYANCIKLQ